MGKAIIDLSGNEGNAFILLSLAKQFAKKLDLDDEKIIEEMQKSDYYNLLKVFRKYFDKYVSLVYGKSGEYYEGWNEEEE
jgi:hypothetical protein